MPTSKPLGFFRRRFRSDTKELENRLHLQARQLKLAERRFHEAVRERPNFYGTELNTRNHWEQKPLRNQARHLYENDPVTRRVVDSIICNMIGRGVTPVTTGNEAVRKNVDDFLQGWLSSVDGDYLRENTLVGLQSLIVRSLVRDGSVFIQRIYGKGRLSLHVLEGDYLNVYINQPNHDTGNEIINGIEFNKDARVMAYHLYTRHPDNFGVGKYGGHGANFDTVRVPYKDICHVKRLDRAGQIDGVSWLAPAMLDIWNLREYEEAKLKQQKLQSSYTAFVQDNFELSEEEREDFIGADGESPLFGESTRSVQPGFVEELPPGKTITFPSPSNTLNENFVERCLRRIAGAMGVSYEIFNDYSNVNFSSGRMGFLEMNRHLRHQLESTVIPQCLMRIGEWVLDHLQRNKVIPEEHDVSIRWSPEAPVMIDPEKEIASVQTEVASNFISMKEAMSKLGYDFDKTLKEIKDSNEKLDEAGLTGLMYGQGGVLSREFMAKINKVPIRNVINFADYDKLLVNLMTQQQSDISDKDASAEQKAADAALKLEQVNKTAIEGDSLAAEPGSQGEAEGSDSTDVADV